MDYKELFDKSFKLAAELMDIKAENARLRAERDAAVEDIKHRDNCDVCAFAKYDDGCDESDFDCAACKKKCPCATCRYESNWKWRGAKGENDGDV